jgi:hypothetical protein
MRRWLALLAALLALAQPAIAGELRVTVLEYGLYTAEVVEHRREPDGVMTDLLDRLCHVATTTVVPLRGQLHFGFRFRVDGLETGTPVNLTIAVTFPDATHPPVESGPVKRHLRQSREVVGALSFTGYSFDEDWEFVTGPWTIEVMQGERSLAAVKFTVVDEARPDFPSPGQASCFTVSGL